MSEDEVRIALLDHYSSQTQNHAMELLTIALVGLGFLQLFPDSSLMKPTSYSFFRWLVISGLFTFGTRTLLRMLYWGFLSGAILQVPRERGVESLAERKPKKWDEKWDDHVLPTNVLHTAAYMLVHVKHPRTAKYADGKAIFRFWGLVTVVLWVGIVGLMFLLAHLKIGM